MGKAAFGTVLQVQAGAVGSTASYTSIGEVRDIAGGGFTVDTADVTHHKSAMEEVVPTVIRTQELTFTVNYNPRATTHGGTGSVALRQRLLNRDKRTFKLITPAATSTAADVLHFNAFVTGMNLNYPVADGETAEFTVKPVGPTASSYSTLSAIP
jgi:hypothetical protein